MKRTINFTLQKYLWEILFYLSSQQFYEESAVIKIIRPLLRAKLIILSPLRWTFFPRQNEFKDPIRADFSVKRNSKYAVVVVLLRHGFIFALHEKGILHRTSLLRISRFLRPISELILRCSILLFYSNFSS